jgi:site-specific recombinase XerD
MQEINGQSVPQSVFQGAVSGVGGNLSNAATESMSSYGADSHLLSEVVPQFLAYGRYECAFAKETIQKYRECSGWIIRDIGDMPVERLDLAYIGVLRQKVADRGAGPSRMATMVYVLKHLLRFSSKNLGLRVMDPNLISPPKRPRREVVFLSNEEIEQFFNSIKIENRYANTHKNVKQINVDGLRFRALVEVLLGTAMRISEALSLNRNSIDFEKKEAKIIGKGNKERVVFFNDRSLQWVRFYLEQRTDTLEPIFVTGSGTRLNRADVSKIFQGYVKKSGITKKITPHILRHTTATNLLFNGCPMAHIKEILGHERLETTCRYYLGLDRRKAKEAHHQYLSY